MANFIKKNIHPHLTETGFTLLEVMMATLIIGIGMVGVLSLIVQNIQVQYINKNILIASQLAQEGLELVRNVRDENWLDDNNYDLDIIGDGTYVIDYSGRGSIDASVNSVDADGAKLYIDSNDFYTHASPGNTETIFYRLITVNNQTSYLETECAVRWEERDQAHDYVAETVLYNWR